MAFIPVFFTVLQRAKYYLSSIFRYRYSVNETGNIETTLFWGYK